MTRRAFTQDQLLDRTGFPGPVTPQVPQDRVRQTYRGGPTYQAPFRSMPEFQAPGSSRGCDDCKLPPIGMGALPAGAFAGAIGMMLAGIRSKPVYHTPGTPSSRVLEDAGLGKGGGHHHGGGGHHHGGGRRGRGGAWYGGDWGGDTYIVDNTNPCPIGYYWDNVALRCIKVPTVVLRGLAALGSTESDICTGLRLGATLDSLATNACDHITDAGFKSACKATFIAINAGIAAGCAQVDAAAARQAAQAAAAAGDAAAAAHAAQAAADAEAAQAAYIAQQNAAKAYTQPQTNYVPWVIGAAVLGGAFLLFRK